MLVDQPVKSSSPERWISYALLVLVLGATTFAWHRAKQELATVAHARLEHHLERSVEGLKGRLLDYEQALRGAAGWFDAMPHPSQAQWGSYFEGLQAQQAYPGVQNFGYAPFLERKMAAQFLALAQAANVQEFSLRPEGERDYYVPVLYNAPLNERTLRAIGYDMYSEATRRAALDLARDSGRMVLTSKIVLVTEHKQEQQAGLLMYLPLYRGGQAAQSLDLRRSRLRGFVYAAFRINDLVRGALGPRASDYEVELVDETASGADRLLYSSASSQELARIKDQDPTCVGEREAEVGDRHWRIRVTIRPEALSSVARVVPNLLLAAGSTFAVLGFVLLRMLGGQRLRAAQVERAGAQVRHANEKLNASVTELERHADELGKLREMNEWVQNCANLEEGAEVLATFAQQLFEMATGGVLLANSAGRFEVGAAHWGAPCLEEGSLRSEDCWALRRGKLLLADQNHGHMRCRHVDMDPSRTYVCAPLVAQGETFGMLHLRQRDSHSGQLSECGTLIELFVEQAALSLGNLRLRDTLRAQSIRDPLTGLFNRRYLEETLTREERRAERTNTAIGLIVIDVDHFKRLNDTYGHAGGDAVLKAIGGLLRRELRQSDIACRYGGEEFVLALPCASLENTLKKAEQLRRKVVELSIEAGTTTITGVTISLGVGAYPNDASAWQDLLHKADLALYVAKKAGRNQVRAAAELTAVNERDAHLPKVA